MEMIRFLRRRDIQLRRDHAHSSPPRQLELFALPSILQPYPQLDKPPPEKSSVVARPSVVAGQKYEDVSRAYIRAVHSVLTGKTIPSVAAAALARELVGITGFRERPASERIW